MKEIPSLKMTKDEFEAQYLNVSDEVKQIWNQQLMILDEFERVCNKYNLEWFADGGTLLGAVRHRGFIPWDDDIDIQMFAEDYEKLRKVAQQEFVYPYFFQNWETEKGFLPWIIKLRKSDVLAYTYFEEENGHDWNKGVFLDIFPLYFVPNNKLKKYLQIVILKILRMAIRGYVSIQTDNDMADSIVLSKLFKVIYRLIHFIGDYEKLSRLYLKVASWEKKTTKEVGVLSFAPGEKKLVWDTKWFSETVQMPFMDRTIPAPCNWDERLTRQYGEYMTPKKNSSRHGGLKIKLTDQSEAQWLEHDV